MARSIVDIWAQSTTYTDLFNQLKKLSKQKLVMKKMCNIIQDLLTLIVK